ncbi:MAG: ABC transporter ATP-binding protein [Candidatus Neomarinimicrobiota bacterium]
MEASISLKRVGKVIDGRSVLVGLSFGVERGSLVALVGPNDAGKSTLLKVLAGIARPEFGNVFINGLDTQLRRDETKRMIGYMPQASNLDNQLTLRENFQFHAALYGLTGNALTNRIGKLAHAFSIQDYLDDFPRSLSHGFLKRAMVVRTLLHDPEILLLDEPGTSLDIRSRYLVWEYLQSTRHKKTVVYTTQSLEEAERMHDRIAIIDKGKIVLDGTLDRLLHDSGELYHFQLHFDHLPDELYAQLVKVSTVVNPSRIGEIFDFHGRDRKVLLQVIKQSIESAFLDYRSDRVGLETLLLTSTEGSVV